MGRLAGFAVYAFFRATTVLLVSAGAAALLGSPFVMQSSAEWAEWLTPVRRTSLALGSAFLVGGIGAVVMAPAFRDFLRLPDRDERAPAAMIALLAALAAIAAAQLPTLMAWWADSALIVNQLRPTRPDPLGLWVIPAAFVVAPPVLASVAIGLVIATAIGVATLQESTARAVWRTGLTLQAGLVIGSALALPEIRALALRVLDALRSGPDGAIVTAIEEALTRQDLFASGLLLRFEWLLAGCFATGAFLWESPAVPDEQPGAGVPSSAARFAPATLAVPVGLRPAQVSNATMDDYLVRVRSPWILAALHVVPLDYDIAPAGTRRGERFVFAGKTGMLQRASDGQPILHVDRQLRLALSSACVMTTPSDGRVVASFEPEGNDWAVLDPTGRTIARVLEVRRGEWYARYRLVVDETDECLFTWGMQGFGVWTSQMEVEFLSGERPRFDRTVALAFAPMLERRSRHTSERLVS
jgi:hypothetical protein